MITLILTYLVIFFQEKCSIIYEHSWFQDKMIKTMIISPGYFIIICSNCAHWCILTWETMFANKKNHCSYSECQNGLSESSAKKYVAKWLKFSYKVEHMGWKIHKFYEFWSFLTSFMFLKYINLNLVQMSSSNLLRPTFWM